MIVFRVLVLAVLGAVTVAAVRLLILRSLDLIGERLQLDSKAMGQILGYATSLPELVVVIASAWAGVFDAGFWNIASSNIINWVLFLAALIFYRQYRDLGTRAFFDELAFGVVSVAIPVTMATTGVTLSTATAIGLIGLFIVYKLLDRVLNRRIVRPEPRPNTSARGSLARGLIGLAAGIVVIAVCGSLIGRTASTLINEIGVPAWMVGWILGFVTSVPEMSSFFGIYAIHKQRGTLAETEDTQESLDTLIASNMSNLGIILPVGVLVLNLL